MYLENQANKVGKNGRSSRLCLNWRHTLTRLRPDYRQTVEAMLIETAWAEDYEEIMNVRDNVRAWEKRVSQSFANGQNFQAIPFQTERANNAPEGLIVL